MEGAEFTRWYGAWQALRPADVPALLAGFDRPWWVAGGWALEAFTGVTRPHEDLDVGLFLRDAPALREAIGARGTLWAAASGALSPYVDAVPDGAHQFWLRPDAASPWQLDLLLTPDRDGRWVNRRATDMALPLEQVTWERDGIRYLAPEVVLLFKARHQRPKDDADLAATLPLLDDAQRAWLVDALEQVHPGHPWTARVTAAVPQRR